MYIWRLRLAPRVELQALLDLLGDAQHRAIPGHLAQQCLIIVTIIIHCTCIHIYIYTYIYIYIYIHIVVYLVVLLGDAQQRAILGHLVFVDIVICTVTIISSFMSLLMMAYYYYYQ